MKTRFFYVLLLLCFSTAVWSDEKGREIASKAWEMDRGFVDFSAKLTLILKKKGKKPVVLRMRTKTLEHKDGDKSISVVDYPADVKGGARLTYAGMEGKDRHWIYLPSNKRVKRISTDKDSKPYMGADFTFEDLATQRPESVDKFSYRYIRKERCSKKTPNKEGACHVIERRPNSKSSGYVRQIIWVDVDKYRTWRIDYFDKKNKYSKTLLYKKYKKYNRRFWRASEMLMVSKGKKSTTRILWEEYKFDNDFNENSFTPTNLKRAK
jgi:outer membrane lipoprotein-sorting protein